MPKDLCCYFVRLPHHFRAITACPVVVSALMVHNRGAGVAGITAAVSVLSEPRPSMLLVANP